MTFTVTDATSGAEILAPNLPLNRVCLLIGSGFYRGTEALADELARLNPTEGFTITDWDSRRIYVRRTA